MLKTVLATGTALAAICAASIAHADEAPATPAAAPAPAASEQTGPEQTATEQSGSDIIVTGSTRAERRFDVSYAVNTISQVDMEKIAPVNFADLIGQLPGFQTEITGGEVQNIYRIRGLPSDGSFVSFQQDGLTLFHETDGVFFRGDAIIKPDLMTDRLEVARRSFAGLRQLRRRDHQRDHGDGQRHPARQGASDVGRHRALPPRRVPGRADQR
jgi:outer membrane receptor protein involved in Fe transport